MNRGFASIGILIALIAVILIGGGGYWYVMEQAAPAPATLPILDDIYNGGPLQNAKPSPPPNSAGDSAQATTAIGTANWKTYTNTKHGYSIQYPATVSVSEYPSDACSSVVLNDANKSWSIPIVWDDNSSPCFGTGISGSWRDVSDTVTVGGKQITVNGRADNNNPFGLFSFALSNRVIVRYWVSVASTNQEYASKLAAMHEIISTLKTLSVPVSTDNPTVWKTFTNAGHGISISFPNTFISTDGKEDFVTHRENEGTIGQNSEYFYFCDGTYMPPTGKVCSGPFYYFGIALHDYVVTQELIKSWGGEVVYSQQTMVNEKPAWVVKMCAANGCSASIMFNHNGGTLAVGFYNYLYADAASPLFISELGEEILSTLKF